MQKETSPQIENGYVRIANELMDALCRFRIPGEIAQVINCIIRKTYGYRKKEDWIAQSQIISMTGMLKGNVSRALSKAITHKIVIRSDNKLKLNKHYSEWIDFGKVIKSDSRVITSATKVIKSEGNKRQYTKDNIQKKYLSLTSSDHNKKEEKVKVYERKPPEKQTQLHKVCYYLEDILDTKIVNWPKQARALQMILKAGYTEKQILFAIKYLAKADEFWSERGFDLMTVANQIGNIRTMMRKGVKQDGVLPQIN